MGTDCKVMTVSLNLMEDWEGEHQHSRFSVLVTFGIKFPRLGVSEVGVLKGFGVSTDLVLG